jgi:undecaprenyl-phosphate 4-deoxy-4-formamido-L-arabinose transferase
MNVKVSIVIPVYNSEASLKELLPRIEMAMKNISHELILVDDGSKDNSWKTIEEYKKNSSHKVIAVKLARNFGQHNAILCALNYCEGELIITMDDDLQHLPEEIVKLIEKSAMTDADVVYGVFDKKQHDMIRNAGSYFIKKTSKHTANTIGEGSSFRLIKRGIINKIKENHQQNFLFIDEIIQWYTANIATVALTHAPRKYGNSTYSYRKLFSMYMNILINYTAIPLKIMTYSGLLFSFITFCFGIRFIFRKLMYNVPLGYTSLIVSILFTSSIMLLCLGIIGQYIYKLYQFQHRKPPYAIQKVI